MEDLLNKKEIDNILIEVKKDNYANDKVFHLGRHKTSIINHSKQTGLILIKGNTDTGYDHIINRHSLMSRIPYWNREGNLGNKSKFRIENTPIDYIRIANEIFTINNLNCSINHRPDKFDLYIGEYIHFDSKKIKYRLLTYKNTGIIHNLFVSSNSKPFNPKKILNLRKGWANAKCSSNLHIFNYSYFDQIKIERAKIIIKCHLKSEKEEWFVEIYDSKSKLVYSEQVKSLEYKRIGIQDKIEQLDFGDTSWVEKIIKKNMTEQKPKI